MTLPTRVTRVDDWWESKLAPLTAASILAAAAAGVDPSSAQRRLARLLCAAAPVAAAAHIVNDLSDREQDEAVGKTPGFAEVGPGVAVVFAGSLLTAGTAVWLGMDRSRSDDVLYATIVALPFAYSVRPVRLKERGFAGVAADAMLAHVVPTALATAIGSRPGTPDRRVNRALVGWSVAAGLRGIVGHQIVDRPADLASGTRTFAASQSVERLDRLMEQLLFPAEVVGLAAVALATRRRLPWVHRVALGIAAAPVLARVGQLWQTPLPVSPEVGSDRVVLWKWYRCWPAIVAAVGATARDRRWAPSIALVTVLFGRALLDDLGSLRAYAAKLGGPGEIDAFVDGSEHTAKRALHRTKAALRRWAPRTWERAKRVSPRRGVVAGHA